VRKKNIRYTKSKFGEIGPVQKNFLPPREELVPRGSTAKATLSLSNIRLRHKLEFNLGLNLASI